MGPRLKTAGMLGIIAGLAGLIGFGFFQTSGFTLAMADTANVIAWVNANLGRLRITIFFYLVSIGAAAIFVWRRGQILT